MNLEILNPNTLYKMTISCGEESKFVIKVIYGDLNLLECQLKRFIFDGKLFTPHELSKNLYSGIVQVKFNRGYVATIEELDTSKWNFRKFIKMAHKHGIRTCDMSHTRLPLTVYESSVNKFLNTIGLRYKGGYYNNHLVNTYLDSIPSDLDIKLIKEVGVLSLKENHLIDLEDIRNHSAVTNNLKMLIPSYKKNYENNKRTIDVNKVKQQIRESEGITHELYLKLNKLTTS